MGCDIHFHTEVKVAGKWEHYGHPQVARNYQLFALLANIRNEDGDTVPVSLPKGMPVDPSLITKLSCEQFGRDGHSHSWLSAQEIVAFEDAWHDVHPIATSFDTQTDIESHLFGYLERNSWAGFAKYPTERPSWIEDVRWVFWFDN